MTRRDSRDDCNTHTRGQIVTGVIVVVLMLAVAAYLQYRDHQPKLRCPPDPAAAQAGRGPADLHLKAGDVHLCLLPVAALSYTLVSKDTALSCRS